MKALWREYREAALYLLFGGATTLLNWLTYILLVRGPQMDVTPANAIAWSVAVAFAFVTNKLYVFRSRAWKWKKLFWEAGSFLAARALSGVLEIFAPALLMRVGLDQSLFGVEGFAAKLVVSVLVVLLNYVFSKWLIFRKH